MFYSIGGGWVGRYSYVKQKYEETKRKSGKASSGKLMVLYLSQLPALIFVAKGKVVEFYENLICSPYFGDHKTLHRPTVCSTSS